MKVTSILKGSTVKAAKPNKSFGYIPDLIAAIGEHFKFIELPTDLTKLIPHGNVEAEAPAFFRHGTIEIEGRPFVIEELQVFQNGTIVSTYGNTNDSDLITDYLFKWANERFQLEFEPIKPIGHFSQLEVQFEHRLAELFPVLKEIGQAINKAIDPFWDPMPPYELLNLHFGMDPSKAPQNNPGLFKIEARAQMPFSLGLYFCEASMSTDNHLTILNRFERICLEKLV